MKNIESTVVELGAIFQQLAHMVKEQEEMVQRSVIGAICYSALKLIFQSGKNR